jgi:hypothetical protein
MPITKSEDGRLSAIISDTSIDKDEEMMDVSLLRKWASDPNKFIPMQKDHNWTIDNMIGHWKNPQVVPDNSGEHHALVMEPVFYRGIKSADEILLRINQGANIGLSIGAMPVSSKTMEKDGKKYKVWTEANLLEVSVTPIPSNNHTYMSVAKSFVMKYGDEEKCPAEESPEKESDYKSSGEEQSEPETDETTTKNIGDKMTEEVKETNETLEVLKSIKEGFDSLKSEIAELKAKKPEVKEAPKEETVTDRVGVLKAQVQMPTVKEEIVEKSEYGLTDMLFASYGRNDLIR